MSTPSDLEVLSWRAEAATEPEFLPVDARDAPRASKVTSSRCERRWAGACARTPDHPFVVAGDRAAPPRSKLARGAHRRRLAAAGAERGVTDPRAPPALDHGRGDCRRGLTERDVIVRPRRGRRSMPSPAQSAERAQRCSRRIRAARGPAPRRGAQRCDAPRRAAGAGGCRSTVPRSAPPGTAPMFRSSFEADERFWRVVGLYIAEGHCSIDGSRHRLMLVLPPRRRNKTSSTRSPTSGGATA